MKNLSLLFNGILAIGLIILYALHFSGEQPQPVEKAPAPKEETTSGNNNMMVYYINTDSLLAGYQMSADFEAEFEKEKNKREARFQGKVKKLEQDYMSIQQNAPTMSETIRNAQIRALQEQEAQLMEEKNVMEQKLFQINTNMTNELNLSVKEYVEKFVEGKNVSYVMMHGGVSALAYANEELDITQEILVGLNAAYEAEKLAEEKAE